MPRRTRPTAPLSALQPGRRVARRRLGVGWVISVVAVVALIALLIAWLA